MIHTEKLLLLSMSIHDLVLSALILVHEVIFAKSTPLILKTPITFLHGKDVLDKCLKRNVENGR